MAYKDYIPELYERTHHGLDIIKRYYSNAETGKNFRVRDDDKHPSASLRLSKGKYSCYMMIDRGGSDNDSKSPIDICMQETGLDFKSALAFLCSEFGIECDYKSSVKTNRVEPSIEFRPAPAEAQKGYCDYKVHKKLSQAELEILCPGFTEELADELHWQSLEWFEMYCEEKTDRNGNVTEPPRIMRKTATDQAPILMRECIIPDRTCNDGSVIKGYSFYKIYTPIGDKAFRFCYLQPDGQKPANYINGLLELKAAYDRYNEEEREKYEEAHSGDDDDLEETPRKRRKQKPYEPKKLPAAVICSGERDACSCLKLGYQPIWFNSETADFTKEMFFEIQEYAEKIYNVPDLDNTGIEKGKEKARNHPDLYTIWLPEELASFRDHRGSKGKDLRDWMDWETSRDASYDRRVRHKRSFSDMLEDALPAKFWEFTTNPKTGKQECAISMVRLLHFLYIHGFCALSDDNAENIRYVRVEGNVVREIRSRDIRRFVVNWAESHYLHESIRNMILGSKKFANESLENLRERTLNFVNYSADSQLMFFKNGTVMVTAEDIKVIDPKKLKRTVYVWESKVFPHTIVLPKPKVSGDPTPWLFTIEESCIVKGEQWYSIRFNAPVESNILQYLINTSRLYWRKELEYNFTDDDGFMDVNAAHDYHDKNRFRIDGEGLSEEEIAEQMQNLVSKIFTIGYMMHKFKSPSRAWAPFAMDNKIGRTNECNGRSGKSFLFTALSHYLNHVHISGRDLKGMENSFLWDQVNLGTDFILVDDLDKKMPLSRFYDMITSCLVVNVKNKSSCTLNFKDSPKIAFTTNYVPSDFDASTQARMLFLVFSDYYHMRSKQNDYLEDRSISDDFGGDLFSEDYTEQQWNADSVFLLECLRFYLHHCKKGGKIQPDVRNIIKRKLKDDIGEDFEMWAQDFFFEGSENLDRVLFRDEVFEECKASINAPKMSAKRFNQCIRDFCELTDYICELNPACLLSPDGRPRFWYGDKLRTFIYVCTHDAMKLGPPSLKYIDLPAPRASKANTSYSSSETDDDTDFFVDEEQM